MNSSLPVKTGTWPNVKGASVVKPYPTVASSERGTTRLILRNVWDSYHIYLSQEKNPPHRQMGNGFRAAMNAGDPLGRVNYSCGGPNMIGGVGSMFMPPSTKDGGQSKNKCDGTGIPPQTCNVKYVYDSSDVTTYRKQRAINRGYSFYNNSVNSGTGVKSLSNRNLAFDYTYGGANNGSQSALAYVRG